MMKSSANGDRAKASITNLASFSFGYLPIGICKDVQQRPFGRASSQHGANVSLCSIDVSLLEPVFL